MSVLAAVLAMVAAALAAGKATTLPSPQTPGLASSVVLLGGAVLLLAWRSRQWWDPHQVALVALAALVALGAGRLVRRRRAARAADHTADRVLAVCEALSSDLAAGQPPLASLDRVGAEWPELSPVAAAARMGADVPSTLRELSARPGARQLCTVAAAWQVAAESGAGLASSIGQAAEAIRQDRRTARLVAGELAAARATARTLAVLPLGVLLLGTGLGGDPVGFLLDSVPGLVCLALGLALSFAGLLWLEKIADHVLGR